MFIEQFAQRYKQLTLDEKPMMGETWNARANDFRAGSHGFLTLNIDVQKPNCTPILHANISEGKQDVVSFPSQSISLSGLHRRVKEYTSSNLNNKRHERLSNARKSVLPYQHCSTARFAKAATAARLPVWATGPIPLLWPAKSNIIRQQPPYYPSSFALISHTRPQQHPLLQTAEMAPMPEDAVESKPPATAL